MRHCTDWNDGWSFCKCPGEAPPVSAWAGGEPVTLPHTWYEDGEYYRGNALYQKRFRLAPEEGNCVFLRFDGVDKVCTVYLNGHEVGRHEGGYTAFAVELTGQIAPDGENLLTVLVNNETGETVSPLSGDFASFGGIYRKVELVQVPAVHFPLCYYGAPGILARAKIENGAGLLSVTIPEGTLLPGDVQMCCRLTDASGETVAECCVPAAETAKMTLASPRRWNGTKDPYLYTLHAALYRAEEPLDEVAVKVGFRTIAVDPDQGFFLNGVHLKLHGVAKHQDTAGVYSAAQERHWQQDMALIEEVGANAVRLSHYPHPQRFYELCDEHGLVVWAEIPMLKLTLNGDLMENAKQQLREMILQNLHHPSICFWGLQNEIAIFGDKPYMAERLEDLNLLAHSLDPDRLTACANLNAVTCESGLNRVTDVTAYNIYFGWYYGKMADHADFLDEFHRVNPGMPLAVSEYGADCNPKFHSDTPRVNDYSEEFQALYHETVYPTMAARDFVWGSFVWNMFDFVSAIRNSGGVKARNIKGLVTFDRALRKDSFYYYKAMWSSDPFVHIAGKRYVNRAAGTMRVKVYSNQPEVTLSAGGTVRTAAVFNGGACFEDIPLNPGENRMTASAGNCTDEAVFIRVDQPDASYVYVDEHPGLNVRNWFADEAEEARLFPEDAYSLRDKLSVLLRSPEVVKLVETEQPVIAKLMHEAPDTFSLDRVIAHEKPDVPEEEIKQLNRKLIKIPKNLP